MTAPEEVSQQTEAPLPSADQPPPGQPAAPPRRLHRPETHVHLFGRTLPRATGFERVFWASIFLSCLLVLCLAAFFLKPDPRGFGTHEQLGLPPCGFVDAFEGVPCPSCGYTTTFTLAVHGMPVKAFTNQPFGFMVFLATVLALPLTGLAVVKQVSLFGVTERWRWAWILLAMFLLWILGWIYKWRLMSG